MVQIAETVRASRRDQTIPSGNINDLSSLPPYRCRPILLDPTCGSGSAVRAAEITRGEVAFPRYGCAGNRHDRIEGKIRMLNCEKSSGVDAPRKKNTFLAPHPLQDFLSGRGCAPGFTAIMNQSLTQQNTISAEVVLDYLDHQSDPNCTARIVQSTT
jgi:hypothetical protein